MGNRGLTAGAVILIMATYLRSRDGDGLNVREAVSC